MRSLPNTQKWQSCMRNSSITSKLIQRPVALLTVPLTWSLDIWNFIYCQYSYIDCLFACKKGLAPINQTLRTPLVAAAKKVNLRGDSGMNWFSSAWTWAALAGDCSGTSFGKILTGFLTSRAPFYFDCRELNMRVWCSWMSKVNELCSFGLPFVKKRS